MKKQSIKTPRYNAVKTINGYAVIDMKARAVKQLYYAPHSAINTENVDNEVRMAKIAGLLNLLDGNVADERIRIQAENMLENFTTLKM